MKKVLFLCFLFNASFCVDDYQDKKAIPHKEYKAVRESFYDLKEESEEFGEMRKWLRTEVGNNEIYFNCLGSFNSIGVTGWQVYLAIGFLLLSEEKRTVQVRKTLDTLEELEDREIGFMNFEGRFTVKISADKLLYIAKRHGTYITEQHEFEKYERY